MKNVFIFGAGASHRAGGPLMSDFYDCAERHRRLGTGNINEAREAFDDVSKAITELQAVHAKSYLDLDNIEILFGAIEMGIMINKFADRSPERIKTLRESMVTLIYKTLEFSIPFPLRDGVIYPPQPYDTFADILNKKRRHGSNQHQYSFLTFNYDLALDYALHFRNIPYDYCLDKDSPKGKSPLLKLHGSINWGTCPECKHIVPSLVGEAKFGHFLEGLESVFFNLGSTITSKQHCQKTNLLGPPILVPPTWNKNEYHESLRNVWRQAARELAEAQNIFVVGYSLPKTDSFFRYLYALGTEGPTRLERFWVFDPDQSGSVERRFRDIIGRGIASRFEFSNKTFSEAITTVKKALEQP